MQSQNVSPTDPEYIKAHSFLSAVQQSQMFRKMTQQKAQNAGINGPTTNGANGPTQQDGGTGPPANPPAIPSAINGQASNGAPARMAPPNGTFSAEQLAILRNQIQAFKLLSKNLAIPLKVQQQLFPTPKKQQSTSAETPRQESDEAEKTVEKEPAADVPVPVKASFSTFESPHASIPSTISFADHSQRAKRLRIPSLMPMGVDIDQIREERERILYNRVQTRRAELAALPANIGSWDTSKSGKPDGDDKLKLKALIEFKKLSLLQKQRDFRRDIQQDLFTYNNLAMTANRSQHRRMKKQSLREARITDKLEKQQRDARETKEKKKQLDYFASIVQHGNDVRANANAQRCRVQKLGRMMVSHHQHMEREEQKRIERTAKQRLQALKANDEETYMKLLGQAKDSRITHLLKQTDGFLSQLAASVRQQQRTAVERYRDDDMYEEEEEDEAGDGSEDDEGGRKVDYYAVAHRIKEDVTRQPGLLVGGTLKEYQIKGLQWMISLYNNNLNGILADEMGLGKTIQTISLITYLIEKKRQNGPFLVIVPLSTLTNWNMEFEKWAPSVNRIVYKGPPAARKLQQQKIRYGQFQVLLTTYEYIIKDRPVLSKVKWVHMIVDEGHRMKNANSKLSSTLTQYYITRYRLILTGTPLQNNLPELWALLNFVLPNIFKSVKSFDEWFNTPFANTGGQDKMELSEEEQLLVIRRLHKVLRPFLLRRLKKDVEKDLPDKQERVIKCRFSALQAKLYKQLVTHNKLAVTDGKGGKTGMRGLSNMLMQLRKLCNHPFVFEPVEEEMNPGKFTNDLIWRTAGKFELLDRVLPKFKASGHRVLMFFQMTQIMNIMEDFLRMRGMKYLRLDGSTKSDDRSELLKQFNAPGSEYFCFLLSTRAGGLGLNLQTADTVIIYDSDWNPHQDLQAQDRAHRIGQKNEVRILRLISSNSVEEKILERANYKLDMDGKVIQAGKFDNKSTNEERDALLRTLLETAEAAEALGEQQDEMDDEDLNDMMARSEDELVLFQQMDEERIRNDKYGPGHKLPRLMAEEELPDIYLAEDNPVAEEVEEYAGRGARVRTVARYDDGLSEDQWLLAVDADDDTIEDAVARKEARIEKRRTNKEKRARKAQGIESSPEPSIDGDETPQPKRRGRKPGPQKRKIEEIEEELPASKRKRGAAGRQSTKGSNDPLSVSDRNTLQKSLRGVFDMLKALEVEESDDPDDSQPESDQGPPTRLIIHPFLVLPPKKDYPDYYQFILNPISMAEIDAKLKKERYNSFREFKDDVGLLATNARTYNEDGSLLYQDAGTIEVCNQLTQAVDLLANHYLQQASNTAIRTLSEKHPHLASLDPDNDLDNDNSYMDGQSSTANVSSVGTPMAHTGNGNMHGSTKLRLTFNANTNGSASASATGSRGGSRGRGGGTTTGTGGTDSGVGSDEE
jgi:ATP-dependent helicase STH1/SNF2